MSVSGLTPNTFTPHLQQLGLDEKLHNIFQKSWARAHRDWLLPQWRNVLFSDESRFGLASDDYRERREREEDKID
nr:unnamed protein product [Callosobruchus chinensis]